MDIGARVVRGPDWTHGESDGGEGHLGTVVKICDQFMCDVIWDSGHRHKYRAGRDGNHDLLVLDTGPTGLQHPSFTCTGCEVSNTGCDVSSIAGTRWTCKTCTTCHLCTVCYGETKHEITHEFLRCDTVKCNGVTVSPRQSSIRMSATGLFPNAKVKKGPDWSSEDKIGSASGKIVSMEDHPSGASVRSMVRVEWEDGQSGLYRAGHEGKVDVQYITEYPGTFYYREHLGVFTVAETDVLAEDGPTTTNNESSSVSKTSQSKTSTNSFSPGDKVSIKVTTEKLEELLTKANIWTPIIKRLAPLFGEVKSYTEEGHVVVTFERLFGALAKDNTLSVCEEALIKIPTHHPETIVRMTQNDELLRVLQNGHGAYSSDMAHALGKYGRVRKLTESGDVVVSFGPSAWQFNPALCTLAPGKVEEKIEDLMSQHLESIEIAFGNHVDMETKVDGVPTTDRGLIQKADAMFDAFSRGNFRLCIAVLRLDPRLKRILHKGYTPMILAAATGAADLVRMLLGEGVDINGRDADSHTPLLHAIYREMDDTVPLLISNGCDVNLTSRKGISPLHLAAIMEKEDFMEMLLQKNANVNQKDGSGNTTGHIGIELDSPEVLGTILKCPRYDPRGTNARQYNILQFASLKGAPKYVEMVLDKYPELIEEVLPETGLTPLHIAANHGHTENSRTLIDKGHANVNAQNPQGVTPLILACVNLFEELVELLLEKGADAKLTDYTGDTPMHYVVRSQLTLGSLNAMSEGNEDELDDKRIKIAGFLMEKGAVLDKTNQIGAKPLDLFINDKVRYGCFYARRDLREKWAEEGYSPETGKHTTEIPTCKCHDHSPPTSPETPGTSNDVPQASQNSPPPTTILTLPCSKCIANMVDVELKPCGHRLLCRSCVSTVGHCPLCNQSIVNVEELQESGEEGQSCKVQ